MHDVLPGTLQGSKVLVKIQKQFEFALVPISSIFCHTSLPLFYICIIYYKTCCWGIWCGVFLKNSNLSLQSINLSWVHSYSISHLKLNRLSNYTYQYDKKKTL